jgi:ABC-type multidrug transport system ATPase subunit
MVRQDILSRKESCSVLISTHHIDDVEVISDRVWFLNNQTLVFDGPISDMKQSFHRGVVDSRKDRPQCHLDFVDFSTSNPAVKEMFLERFGHVVTVLDGESSLHSCRTWSVNLSGPEQTTNLAFRSFLQNELEAQGLLDWSVSSPNVYDSLSRMYAPSVASDENEKTFESKDHHCRDVSATSQNQCNSMIQVITFSVLNIRLMVDLRVADMKQKKRHFLFSSIILPFIMMLILVFYCRDIRYPKMKFTSSSIGGIGEILVSYGRTANTKDSLSDDRAALDRLFGQSTTWLGYDLKSNALFEKLYREYYAHKHDRWSSFVIDDTVEKWVQSSVRITDRSFEGSFDMHDAYSAIQAIQSNICNSSDVVRNESISSPRTRLHNDIDSMADAAFSRVKNTDRGEVSNITDFCNFMTQMDIDLLVNSSSRNNKKKMIAKNTSALVMQVSQALNAKVTMLSNMTFFHGTPMFFKEVLPYIYASRDDISSLGTSKSTEWAENITRTKDVFTLYSYPFDEKKSISPAFIQRGYLGSIIIIMFILLTSTSVLKFITQCRFSGIKTQLHLSGVSPLQYWFANFIVDYCLLSVSFLSIFAAIYVGGPPISSFYMDSANSNTFLFSLCTYAGASVAANYFFAFRSVDQVSSQLMSLFSSLCGGLFLRLFVALHPHVEPYVSIHSVCLWLSPSYAFSSNMYDLFVQYVRHFSPRASHVTTTEVSLYTPLLAMCCQTIVYLTLTVLADTHYYRFSCWLHRLSETTQTCIYECGNNGRLARSNSISLRSTVLRFIAMSSACQISTDQSEEEGLLYSSREHCSYDGSAAAGTRFSSLERSASFLSDHSCDNDVEVDDIEQTPVAISKNLNVAYEKGFLSHSAPILKGFNMCIKKAERIALMGVNGGGKSTLYRTMTNTEMLPIRGKLAVGGFDTVREHWSLGQENVVGYVPQEGGLAEFMTVQSAIDLFIRLRKNAILFRRKESHSRNMEHEELVMKQQMYNILPRRYFPYYIFSLSGGNKQKLAILLSNIFNPDLLLLDEPTSGIDPPAAHELIRYLSTLPPSQAMVFASHRMEECLVVCNRVLLLFGGRLQFDGPISEFSKVTDLFYQVDIEICSMPSCRGANSANASHNVLNQFVNSLLYKLRAVLFPESVEGDGAPTTVFERIVRYSTSKVRFTIEKTKCPLSVMWSILAEWKSEAWESPNICITSFSLRKMSIEEIFAAMVDAAKKTSSSSTYEFMDHAIDRV